MDYLQAVTADAPALVVLCGASGSGKSTLAQATWPGEVVSSDMLRELIGAGQSREDHRDTFDLLHRVVAGRLRRGLRTVVDATNTAQWHRGPLLALAAAHEVPAIAVICWPPLATCLDRNAAREHGRVPADVVTRQYEQLVAQMPSKDEGFARVTVTGADAWITPAQAP